MPFILLIILFIVIICCFVRLFFISLDVPAVFAPLNPALISSQGAGAKEQMVLNACHENAKARGLKRPEVYVFETCESINILTLGDSKGSFVLGLTRGFLDALSREEINAVIAREFSRVSTFYLLKNFFLIGILYPFLVIGLIGSRILDDLSKLTNPMQAIIGALMYGLGFLGILFSRFIKFIFCSFGVLAADRKALREGADADSLAFALMKVGGFENHGKLGTAQAEELSHLFFVNAVGGLNFWIFSTHPSLKRRIRKLLPEWDEEFIAVESLVYEAPAREVGNDPEDSSWVVSLEDGLRLLRPVFSKELIESIPAPLLDFARSPNRAQALILSLLIDDRSDVHSKQMALLSESCSQRLHQDIISARNYLLESKPAHRLPLVEISSVALSSLSKGKADKFYKNVRALIAADGEICLFEYCLHEIVSGYLPEELFLGEAFQYDRGLSLEDATRTLCEAVISEKFSYQKVENAIRKLQNSPSEVVEDAILEVAECIASDRMVTLYELHLIAAVAAALKVELKLDPEERELIAHAQGAPSGLYAGD